MRRLRYLCIAIEFTPTHAALVLGTDQIVHSTKHAKSAGKRPEIGLRDLLQLILAFKRGGHEELKWHPKYLDLDPCCAKDFGHGVDVDTFSNFFTGLKPQDILLLRHPRFQGKFNSGLMASLSRESLYHLDKPYNIFIEFLTEVDAAAFCSQLVCQVLAGSGIEVPAKVPERVLPIDLLIWAHQDNWQIISGEELSSWLAERNAPQAGVSEPEIASQMVDLHRAVVERVRNSRIAVRDIQQVGQGMRDFIAVAESTPFSPREWMQAGVPPMPATVGGLLAAADEISGLSDDSGATLDQRSPAGDTPVDEPTERPSWSLPQGSAKQNAKPDEHNKSAAKRELNRASTILSEFDVAAADASVVLFLLPFGLPLGLPDWPG